MELNFTVLLSGFALGILLGVFASLINIIISAFARWTLAG